MDSQLTVRIDPSLEREVREYSRQHNIPEETIIARALNCPPAGIKVPSRNALSEIVGNVKKPVYTSALKQDKTLCWAVVSLALLSPFYFMHNNLREIVSISGFLLGCLIGLRLDIQYFKLFVKMERKDSGKAVEKKIRIYDPIASMIHLPSRETAGTGGSSIVISGPLAGSIGKLSLSLSMDPEEVVSRTLGNYLDLEKSVVVSIAGNIAWLGVWGAMLALSAITAWLAAGVFLK